MITQNESINPAKEKYVELKFVLSILLVLCAFYGLVRNSVVFMSFLLAALILFPPIRSFLKKEFKIFRRAWIRVSFLVLFLLTGIIAIPNVKNEHHPTNNETTVSRENSRESNFQNVSPYQSYIDQQQIDESNFTISQREHRDSIMNRLNANPFYQDIVVNKIVSSKYIPLLNLLNEGIKAATSKGTSFPLKEAQDVERISSQALKCAVDMSILVNAGGYSQEQVDAFETYRAKYGYYGIGSTINYTIDNTSDTIPCDYNFTAIFSLVNPNNKVVANSIYEAISKGIGNWESKSNNNLLYPYLSNRLAYNDYLKNIDPTSPNLLNYDINVTAEQLAANYDNNEVAADQQFQDKKIRVTGIVESINKDVMDKPFVMLSGGESLVEIHCTIPNENTAAKIQKGYRYSIIGICKGMTLGSVVLNKCEVE